MRFKTTVRLLLIGSVALFSSVHAQPIGTFGPFGGWGGTGFHDALGTGERICQIAVRSGSRIDAIQVQVCDPNGNRYYKPKHGGTGGTLSYFNLDADEYITNIYGYIGSSNGRTTVQALSFDTNKRVNTGYYQFGRSPTINGTSYPANFWIVVPPGYSVQGFLGSSGSELDSLGVDVRKN